jgi:broad specificity phosphatase PhoE
MRQLILIRHSTSKIDPSLPPYRWGLTDHGAARCVPLAERLVEHNPGVIITSDEPKAVQTGEVIAQILELSMHTAPGIHEHRRERGAVTRQEDFVRKIRELFENPERGVFGLETAQQALIRFTNAVQSIMDGFLERNIGIVTHGTVMSLYYGSLTGKDPFEFWSRLGLPAFYTVLWPELEVSSLAMQIEFAE